MSILIVNIKKLYQTEEKGIRFRSGKLMDQVPVIDDAFVYIREDRIEDYGSLKKLPSRYRNEADELIDAGNGLVFPSYCDSHTHIVYAGSREQEFADRIKGMSYEEIAKRGGGILNSARILREVTEDELFEQSSVRIREVIRTGTGAIEIKSGYGLDTESELKMLRVIRRIRDSFPLIVKSTFLGAHALPVEYRDNREGYIERIVYEMIPAVAAEGLADYIDVFCDKGFFNPEETGRILMAGLKYGLRAKIHANELGLTGGVQTGVTYDALSVDHLEYTGKKEIEALLESETIPTLLPGASFFLGIPYAPARAMIDAGLAVAMASDYNPGSSPSGDMRFIMSLACLRYNISPEEALNAVTLNSACAMGVESETGTISRGKKANLFITTCLPGLAYLPYAYTSRPVETVILNGRKIQF